MIRISTADVGGAYRDELIATAVNISLICPTDQILLIWRCFVFQNALVTPGKGLLAADESIATIGKRFADIGVENTVENRIRYQFNSFCVFG